MVRRFTPRFTVWLALSAALACGRRGVPVTARDELVVATPGDPDSSSVGSGLGLHPVNANVYETLVRLTPDFRVAPQLATRWQLRSPKTWRVHLPVEGFDQYWGDRARLRRLTFRFLADANVRLLALRAGEVQVASDLPREAARAARMLPDIAVATSSVGGYEALYVTEPSAAIRRAIVYALDRPRLVEAAWRGTAEPAQLLGPAELLGRSADLVAGARSDPRRARRVLDGAGWTPLPDGIRVKAGRRLALTLVIGPPDVDIHRAMATVVQDQLREAGIDLRIVQLPDSGAYRARIKSGAGELWTGAGG